MLRSALQSAFSPHFHYWNLEVLMAYEMFERTAVRVDTPALSIAPGGKVAINAAACRLLTEAGIKSVVILWDKARNKMAIKAAPKGEKNLFTITFTGRYSASLKAKSFLDHIGWNAPKREMLHTTAACFVTSSSV
jgi:hypothetical protein